MKINKYLTFTLVTLLTLSLVIQSCNKKGLPHRKYRGQAPRGPSK